MRHAFRVKGEQASLYDLRDREGIGLKRALKVSSDTQNGSDA